MREFVGKPEKDNSIVVMSQLEIDLTSSHKAMVGLLEGLESMKPDIIVLIGDFFSAKISEKLAYD
jgi:hypothetical protein